MLAGSLTTPPPKDRSQFPMRVLATMSGIVSGSDQPAASTAMARCARGILSSLIRIWNTGEQLYCNLYTLRHRASYTAENRLFHYRWITKHALKLKHMKINLTSALIGCPPGQFQITLPTYTERPLQVIL